MKRAMDEETTNVVAYLFHSPLSLSLSLLTHSHIHTHALSKVAKECIAIVSLEPGRRLTEQSRGRERRLFFSFVRDRLPLLHLLLFSSSRLCPFSLPLAALLLVPAHTILIGRMRIGIQKGRGDEESREAAKRGGRKEKL